ncbi:hypothetical protein RJT34_32954 [Clitoria ternatea]|uniref:Uncharacterized protein n=1 Tax=Clitoria ternatea TaxID=43366 RepID=A0AAN9F168_CLITE
MQRKKEKRAVFFLHLLLHEMIRVLYIVVTLEEATTIRVNALREGQGGDEREREKKQRRRENESLFQCGEVESIYLLVILVLLSLLLLRMIVIFAVAKIATRTYHDRSF